MALAKKAGSYDQDLMRDMKIAQERHGVSLSKQVFDFLVLRGTGAGLSFEEYHYFRLYQRPRSEYASYMGDHRARAAFYVANDLKNWDEANDKLNFSDSISAARLPSPKILATAHARRDIHGAVILRSTDAIADYLRDCALPIFGKPMVASHGDGCVNLVARDGDLLVNDSGEAVTISELTAEIERYFDKDGYLFQETLRPHPDIAAITNQRIATVRFLALLGPDGVSIREAVLRLPAGDNRVDNFRRAGNLAAPIDIATGVLGPARRGVGVTLEICPTHPDTGVQIDGARLPDFNAAKTIIEKAAEVFPNQHIQSWDVALTDNGPSLLEVNPGGNFNIIQLANGRGAFDPEFQKFLAWCVKANPDAKSNKKALKEAKKLLKLR